MTLLALSSAHFAVHFLDFLLFLRMWAIIYEEAFKKMRGIEFRWRHHFSFFAGYFRLPLNGVLECSSYTWKMLFRDIIPAH